MKRIALLCIALLCVVLAATSLTACGGQLPTALTESISEPGTNRSESAQASAELTEKELEDLLRQIEPEREEPGLLPESEKFTLEDALLSRTDNLLSEHGSERSLFAAVSQGRLRNELGIEVHIDHKSLDVILPQELAFTLTLDNGKKSLAFDMRGDLSYYITPDEEGDPVGNPEGTADSLRCYWGGVSMIDEKRFAVVDCMGKISIYNGDLVLQALEFDGLEQQAAGGTVHGIAYSEDLGYFIPATINSELRILQYSHEGMFLESVEPGFVWPSNHELRLFDQSKIVGKPGRQFTPDLSFDYNFMQPGEVPTELVISQTLRYDVITDEMTRLGERYELGEIDGKTLTLQQIQAEINGVEETFFANLSKENKSEDSFVFQSAGIANHISMLCPNPVCESLGGGKYRASYSKWDVPDRICAQISLDFSLQTGSITYYIEDDDVNMWIGETPNGRYSAATIWHSGAGDGFWYDIAVKDNWTGSWRYLGKRGNLVEQEVEFVDNETLLLKTNMTFYRIADLSPIRQVRINHESIPVRYTVNMLYDTLGERFVYLTAYFDYNDFFWTGLYDTTYCVEVYDNEGNYINLIETDIISRAQRLYVIIPPDLRMEGDMLIVGGVYDDLFAVDVVTETVYEEWGEDAQK